MASGSVRMDGGDRQATRRRGRAGANPLACIQRSGRYRVVAAVAAAQERRPGLAAGRAHPAAIGGRRVAAQPGWPDADARSEEHTSELQSLMRLSYAVFCLKKKR